MKARIIGYDMKRSGRKSSQEALLLFLLIWSQRDGYLSHERSSYAARYGRYPKTERHNEFLDSPIS